MFDFSPVEIKKILEYMSPDCCVTTLTSPSFKDVCTESEKWYGGKYMLLPSVSETSIGTWLSAFKHDYSISALATLQLDKLHMPELNPFVPTPEGLKILAPLDEEVDATDPERVYDDEQSTCFWKQDRTFGIPRVLGSILLANNRVRDTMHDFCCAFLFKEIFSHYINDFNYMASMADTEGFLATNSRGLVIKLVGYSEKIGNFLKLFLETLRDFVPPQKLFDMVKERLLEQAKSSRNDPAYQNALEIAGFYAVRYGQYALMVLEDEYKKITLNDLVEWQNEFKKTGVRILSFFQGNLTKESAIDLTKLASKTLSLPVASSDNLIQNDHCRVPAGVTTYDIARSGEDKNNTVLYSTGTAVHEGEIDENCVYLQLLKSIIKPLFYDELRTKQQLGYVVFTMSSHSCYVDCLDLLVQSNTHDPDYLNDRINDFRRTIPDIVDKVTEESFRGFVDSLITVYSIKDTSMGANASKYWGEIITGDLKFRENEKFIDLAKKCTREGLISFTKKYFSPDAPEKHEFIIRIWGKFQNQADADAAEKKITLLDPKDVLRENKFPLYMHAKHKVFEQ